MRAALGAFAALATGAMLVSVASAGPAATKQRVAIDMKLRPDLSFVLTPKSAGTIKPDSGKMTTAERSTTHLVRSGQELTTYTRVFTLKGKRGTLTIRERSDWVTLGNDINGDGWAGDSVSLGTWRALRGTGQFAGITGGGASGHAGLGDVWYGRLEGILTSP